MIGKVPGPYRAPGVPQQPSVIPQAPPMPAGGIRGAGTSLLGVTAPNERVVDWENISKVQKPFENVGPKDFGFWFNYFWDEAVQVAGLSKAQQVRISEVFLSIFTVNTTRDPRTFKVTVTQPVTYRLRGDFATRENEFKENALRQLLIIGFRRVALKPPTVPISQTRGPAATFKIGKGIMVAKDSSDLNFDITIKSDKNDKIVFPIAFRSDTRTYEELLLSMGFRTRAREDETSEVYIGSAMDQPWHPFNNPVYKNSLFLRLGEKNKDNCLNTVISVGPDLSAIVHFPILSDAALIFTTKSADGKYLALKPLIDWTEADIQLAAAHRYNIRAVKEGGVVDRLEKTNTMHVFHTLGLRGVNTSTYFGGNDAFPERGMEMIPASHLLAEITMTQKYFYREDKAKIDLYDVSFDVVRWVPTEQMVEGKLGKNALLQLKAKLEGQKGLVKGKYAQEMARYQQSVMARATQLTAGDKALILAALKTYYSAAGAKSIERLEKAAVSQTLPLLAAKVMAIGGGDWNEFRRQAKPATVSKWQIKS